MKTLYPRWWKSKHNTNVLWKQDNPEERRLWVMFYQDGGKIEDIKRYSDQWFSDNIHEGGIEILSPYTLVAVPSVKSILQRAKEFVQQGWTKHCYKKQVDAGYNYCAVGALHEVGEVLLNEEWNDSRIKSHVDELIKIAEQSDNKYKPLCQALENSKIKHRFVRHTREKLREMVVETEKLLCKTNNIKELVIWNDRWWRRKKAVLAAFDKAIEACGVEQV